MTEEELVAYKKERKFLETPIGKAFNRFKNAHYAMAADEWNERASHKTIKKHYDAAMEAEREFRELLYKAIENKEQNSENIRRDKS